MPIRPGSDAIVAIPVKNEADRISACLKALNAQNGGHRTQIVLLLNDCTDGTSDIVRGLAPSLDIPVELVECHSAPGRAGAGFARQAAMDYAAAIGGGAALLTTDADSRVAPDWVARNLALLAGAADAVAGRAVIDPEEAALIPRALHDADARECAYADALDRIAALLDPDPADPWPRHSEHSGASIAVSSAMYRRAGGIPPAALGEDRAFFAALRRIDARIRHAPEVHVIVSGRIHGRAAGGMADTIRRRMTAPDALLDDRLEPARDAARRAAIRARLRRLWNSDAERGAVLSMRGRAGVASSAWHGILAQPCFGLAWESFEAASPQLERRRVAAVDLATEMRRAESIIAALEGSVRPELSARPAGIPLCAAWRSASAGPPPP